jgi:hypothetical protein
MTHDTIEWIDQDGRQHLGKGPALEPPDPPPLEACKYCGTEYDVDEDHQDGYCSIICEHCHGIHVRLRSLSTYLDTTSDIPDQRRETIKAIVSSITNDLGELADAVGDELWCLEATKRDYCKLLAKIRER